MSSEAAAAVATYTLNVAAVLDRGIALQMMYDAAQQLGASPHAAWVELAFMRTLRQDSAYLGLSLPFLPVRLMHVARARLLREARITFAPSTCFDAGDDNHRLSVARRSFADALAGLDAFLEEAY